MGLRWIRPYYHIRKLLPGTIMGTASLGTSMNASALRVCLENRYPRRRYGRWLPYLTHRHKDTKTRRITKPADSPGSVIRFTRRHSDLSAFTLCLCALVALCDENSRSRPGMGAPRTQFSFSLGEHRFMINSVVNMFSCLMRAKRGCLLTAPQCHL